MSDSLSKETTPPSEKGDPQDRRLFLQGMGKWSGAAIAAAVTVTWLGTSRQALGGAWVNRRIGGGGWVNRGGGGGGWINRRVGGGAWVNRY